MNIPPGYKTHSRRTCAGVAILMQIKDVTEADAETIRMVWKAANVASLRLALPPEHGVMCESSDLFRAVQRSCVDRIIRTYGVEFAGYARGGRAVYYCNTGDTYAATVLFYGDHLRVGTYGDLIEKNRVTAPVQL